VPRGQQTYKVLKMAIGILVDLLLDSDPNPAFAERGNAFLDFHPEIIGEELARAALGCFYVSST
jgi:hypothetical protein